MVRWFFDLQRFATIENNTSNNLVSGTNNNDSIKNYDSEKVTIVGGDGNDSISNYSKHYFHYAGSSSINGGMGDDYIYNSGKFVTIVGGTGNDSIDR